jgi:RNA polymerase sigma factor (sigma-70 family)
MERGPSPELVAAANDQLQALMDRLSPEQQRALELRLADYTYEEIAERTGRTERTIRRWLADVKVWMTELSSNENDEPLV